MSPRVPIAAAAAVMLASLSLSVVLQGNGWLGGGIGAVIVVTAAGLASRPPGPRFALTASLVVLIGVVPLLVQAAWPALTIGLAILALTAASATGNRSLRGFATLALYLAALLIYLNLVFAGGASYGHLIPSHASIDHLGQLVRNGFSQFQLAPPVSDTSGVSLVGAGGIGLVAIMVDILAVRMQRPAIAGLPLLVLFSVPAASDLKSFGGLQVLTFAAGMAGFLALLSTSGRERLRLWGQLVTFRYVQASHNAGSGPDTKQLAASGRRVGLAAVCLAVIIPVVLPSVRPHDVFATTPAAGGSGSGGAVSTNAGPGAQLDALLQVQRQLREAHPKPVLTYTTTAATPADQYFQVYVLNYNARQDTWLPQFAGRAASQRASGGHALPERPPGQLPSTPADTVVTTVTLNKDQSGAGFLPAPYAPVKLATTTQGWAELPGSLMLFNSAVSLGDLRYSVTSREPVPTPAQIENALSAMPEALLEEYGTYNGPDAAQLRSIASQHTSGASTELQDALDLQAWLTSSSFRYSLKPDLPTSHWLLKFLTTGRRGYCQQFAWAFAVLARVLGIPARIAIGYTGGTPGPPGTWRVTTADAHAWPELYFPGEGWLRFEPTPHGAAGQGTATVPSYASGPAGRGLPATRSGSAGGAAGSTGSGHAANPLGLGGLTHGGPGGLAALSAGSRAARWLLILIPVLVLLLVGWPAATRRLTRRRRWLTATSDAAVAATAWRELTDDLSDYRLGRSPGETPRATARRIRGQLRLDAAADLALGRIVAAAERAQYGKAAGPGAGLADDVLAVRRALAGSVPARQRVRAWLLPASTLAAAQHLLQRAGDMLTWLDTSLPGLRQQLGGAQSRQAG